LILKTNHLGIAIGGCAWAVLVLSGFAVLNSYSYNPGAPGTPPARWPAGSTIPWRPDKVNLVMLAHPECPCTRASLGELDRLLTATPGQVAAQVVFSKPFADPKATDLWDIAASIPGVRVSWDQDGREAALFGASTSGQVVVYDARGDLVFSGGITASRGHSGDNLGRSSILSAVATGRPLRSTTPVFGCSLRTLPQND